MTETEEVWLEDVTGDGRDDLICRAPTSLTGNECAIFVAHSNGINFDGWDFASYNTGITLDDQILFGDIDADEKTDLICRRAAPQSDAGYIYTAMSNGTGFVFWCYQSSTKVLNPGDEIMLGDRHGNTGNIDFLKAVLPEEAFCHITCNGYHRYGIDLRRCDTGDKIHGSRP